MRYVNQTRTRMFVTYKRFIEAYGKSDEDDYIPEQNEYFTVCIDPNEEINDLNMVFVVSVIPVTT